MSQCYGMTFAMPDAIRSITPRIHQAVDVLSSPVATSLAIVVALFCFAATGQMHTQGGYNPWAPTMSAAYLTAGNQ